MNAARIDTTGLSRTDGEAQMRSQKACFTAFLTHNGALLSMWGFIFPTACDGFSSLLHFPHFYKQNTFYSRLTTIWNPFIFLHLFSKPSLFAPFGGDSPVMGSAYP